MEEKTTILAAKGEEKYDAIVKSLFKKPKIIAPILKHVVTEYADLSVEEIAGLFVDISDAVPVDGVSAKAVFLDSEQASMSDKLIRFDVHLKSARFKKGEKQITVYLFIDLEIQNKYTKSELKYPILKRAMYYVARELSGQPGVLTNETDYGRLQKSYSIWICNKVPKEVENTITRYRMTKEDVVGSSKDDPENYDLMEVVFIRRGSDKNLDGVLDYLQGIFTSNIGRIDKYAHIKEDESVRKEVDVMSGFGALIAEENKEKGIILGTIQTLKRLGSPEIRIIDELKSVFGMDEKEAKEYLALS